MSVSSSAFRGLVALFRYGAKAYDGRVSYGDLQAAHIAMEAGKVAMASIAQTSLLFGSVYVGFKAQVTVLNKLGVFSYDPSTVGNHQKNKS